MCWQAAESDEDRSDHERLYFRPAEGGEKGSGVFLVSLWTTARMHCRFEPKLLADLDHPVFATERSASLRTRS
jgi:hypothetical protein